MVDIDYHLQFSCPKCKLNPKVIILDGIAIDITKVIPDCCNQVDETQRFSTVPLPERSFILNPELRRDLQKLCDVGLVEPLFNKVINSSLPKEFVDYIRFTTRVCKSKIVDVSLNYPNAKSVIEFLCHS